MPYLGTNYGILFGVYHSYTTLILYIKCRHTWKVHRVYKNISLSFFFVVLSYWWKGYNHLYFFFNHLKFFILRYTQAVRLVLHLYSWIAKDLQYYFNRLITFLLDSFRAHNSLLYTWVPQSPPLTLSSCFNIFIQKQLGTCFLEFSLSLSLSVFSSSHALLIICLLLGIFSLTVSPVFSSRHASLIICQMCVHFGAERVYQKFAAEIKEGKDLTFAPIIVQVWSISCRIMCKSQRKRARENDEKNHRYKYRSVGWNGSVIFC